LGVRDNPDASPPSCRRCGKAPRGSCYRSQASSSPAVAGARDKFEHCAEVLGGFEAAACRDIVFLGMDRPQSEIATGIFQQTPDTLHAIDFTSRHECDREGPLGGHWDLPTRRPHASKQASARSKPSAMQVNAPASRNAAMQASCLLARPPSAALRGAVV